MDEYYLDTGEKITVYRIFLHKDGEWWQADVDAKINKSKIDCHAVGESKIEAINVLKRYVAKRRSK